ncbi:anti-sigma factor family protein [Plantactinospora sp. GCM10030261]|uniref:anti-sigma factor family protein n=1 Tax=Plantactinospora sp. GCM10030261 TaxID=3273420 RepID=UPI00361D89D5
MSRADHFDVAAYALGVLDPGDIDRFEEHLASCWVCAADLEAMMPVVDLLSDVDGSTIPTADNAPADNVALDRMLATAARDHRRSRRHQVFALAAGFVLLALATGGALVVGRQSAPDTSIAAPPSASASAAPAPTETWVNGQPGPGFGGPDLRGGEKLTATDDTTGVRADLILASKPFGTQLSFALSQLPGPRNCRLVVLRRSGSAEVVSTWTVPVSGYGTGEERMPLMLQAATAVPREDIDRVQVQSIDEKGVATPLVTVPL